MNKHCNLQQPELPREQTETWIVHSLDQNLQSTADKTKYL